MLSMLIIFICPSFTYAVTAGDLRGHIMYPNGDIDAHELYKLTDGNTSTYVDFPINTGVYIYLFQPAQPDPVNYAEVQKIYIKTSATSASDCIDVGTISTYGSTTYIPYNQKDKIINMTDYVDLQAENINIERTAVSTFLIHNFHSPTKRVYEIDFILANDGYVVDYIPKPPTGLYMNNITYNSAKANWTAVTGATSYNVYLDGVKVGTVSSTSTDISGLQPSTTYQVTVSAVNSNGEGSQCTPVTFTTLPPPPPSKPTGLNIVDITTSSARATWNPVTGATSYNVYLDGVKVGTVSNASIDISGLQPSTTYQVAVSAVNTNGEGSQCTPVTFTTLPPPPPSKPTGLNIVDITTSSARATWNPVTGATSYNVYLDGVKVGTVSNASIDISGLQPSTTYQVTVSAVNSNGEGSQCTPVSFTTLPPSPPSDPIWTPLPGIGMGFPVDPSKVFDHLKFMFGLLKGSIWPFITAFLALFTAGLLWKIWRRVAR